jgi:PAP2 superfamily
MLRSMSAARTSLTDHRRTIVKRAMRTLGLAALSTAALATALPAASTAATSVRTTDAAPAAADPVIEWNRFLLNVQATPGEQPATVHPTYELAMLHAAIHDAVVSIDHSGLRYLTRVHSVRGASVAAAADAAAHDTLVKLYPSLQASIDQQYAALAARVPAGARKASGVRVGQRVAAQLLARRADDGSGASPLPFQAATSVGDYQLTPPAFAPPVFTHWRQVKPFVIRRANQFRPPPPLALTSPKYAAAINEVKALGAAQGSTRTPDQTQIGQFWNPPIWAAWNQIAQTAALAHHATLSENASTFATLDLTLADSAIAFYDAKYAYHVWRPVTAIRDADADGNPDTAADPAWTPLSTTAPDPSYPGAHGTISAAAADVLSAIYGNDVAFTVTSPALPGVARSFVSFSEAAHEATVSRIYNGNHTRLDQVAGENLGHDVAGFVLHHNAPPGPVSH